MVQDPGALNVLIDAFVYHADSPTQQAVVQIWGVDRADLSQSSNFTGCIIEVSAGFQRGLPLNNPAQAGVILKGQIIQAFGNWAGTDMTLDFVVVTAGSTADNPVNISFDWQAGMSLNTALATTFTTAFPGLAQDIQISDKLVLTHDEVGIYDSLVPFAQTLRDITRPILGGTYDGVTITMTPKGLMVRDSYKVASPTSAAAPTFTIGGVTYPVVDGMISVPASLLDDQGFINALPSPATVVTNSSGPAVAAARAQGLAVIAGITPNGSQPVAASTPPATTPAPIITDLAFQDLMGQPTWIDAYTITFACPMRYDLTVGSVVRMPKGIVGGSAGAGAPGTVNVMGNSKPSARDGQFFSGVFELYNVHHMGNFRQPDGESWVTVYQGSPKGTN